MNTLFLAHVLLKIIFAKAATPRRQKGQRCTESYYLPYDNYGYNCRTWDGSGQCGTIERTVTNYSARINGGPCQNLWPSGNT